MAGFRETLSDPQGVRTNVPPVKRPNAAANSINTLNKLINIGFEVQDKSTLRDVAGEFEEVTRQESVFQQESSDLRDELLSPSDKSQVDKVEAQLTLLERGANAGKLTPVEASIRRNVILKSAVNDNPWLAQRLKATANVYGSGAGGGSRGGQSKQTVEEQVIEDQRKRAKGAGVDFSEVRDFDNETFKLKATEQRVKQAAADGSLKAPLFRKYGNDRAGLVQASLLGEMMTAFNQDPASLDEEFWETKINNEIDNHTDFMINFSAEAAKNGIVFSEAALKRMDTDSDKSFKIIKEYLKSNNKQAYLTKYKEMVGLVGFKALVKSSPFFATLTGMGIDPNKALEFTGKVHDTMKKVENHGEWGAVVAAAELGDADAKMHVYLMETNVGVLSELTHAGLLTGTVPSDPTRKTFQNLYAGTYLSTPNGKDTMTPGDRDTASKSISSLTDGKSHPEELRWFQKPGTVHNILSDPKLTKQLENRMESSRNGAIANIQQIVQEQFVGKKELATTLKFNKEERQFEQAFTLREGSGFEPGIGVSKLDIYIRQLNNIFKVNKLYGFIPDPAAFVNEVLAAANKRERKKVEASLTNIPDEEVDITGGLD